LVLGAACLIRRRKDDVIQHTAKELSEKHQGTCLAIAGDVRNYEDVERVVAYGYEQLGGIDILINNAAGNFISPTERLSHRAFESVIGIVLQGSINYTLALGKLWIENKDQNKTVLSIVTTYAWTGSGYVVPSATAKAGVLAMTRSLAVEWGKKRYTSKCNCPWPLSDFRCNGTSTTR